MNCKHFIIGILLCFFAFSGKASDEGLRIEIKAPQLKEKELKLINYYNGSNYAQDTITLSKKGTGVFERETKFQEGLYIIYVDSTRFFDLLLGEDQTFTLSIDTSNFVEKNKIEGSIDSEAFMSYTQFLSKKQKERTELFNKYKELKEEEKEKKEKITTQLEELNTEVLAFQDHFFETHKDRWVGKFFKGLKPVTGPHPSPQNREEAVEQFKYLKYHYFDNIDLTDKRFWFTSYFPKSITGYMQSNVEFIPDSLAKAASWLVSQTMDDSICFRLMLGKLFNYGATNEYMGMENIWAKLAEDYYLKGLVSNLDSAFLANVQSEYGKIQYNRIGMPAQNLQLQDTTGNNISLYDIAGKYTLIYFYEPSCGHCKQTTPRIHEELYKKYKDKGFSVACFYTLTDKDEWMKFINDHKLNDWNNVWDPERISYFWRFFDTSVTPGIYLMDEDKKIVAKKLDVESLDKYLSNALKDIESETN
jgi:Peroxiredoxin